MGKVKDNIKKYLPQHLIILLISFVIGVVIFLLLFFLSKNKMTLLAAVNSSAISGVILFSFGILASVNSAGAFDSLTYGFNQLSSSLFAKKANRYNDFNEYRNAKIEKRKNGAYYFLPIIVSSIPFFIALVVLEIIFNA